MHLKNYSLIKRNDKVELSPAHDLLNTTIILSNPREEIALSIKGKKSNLNRDILFDYYGKERLELSNKIIDEYIENIGKSVPSMHDIIEKSFLSNEMKEKYTQLMKDRLKKLGLLSYQ